MPQAAYPTAQDVFNIILSTGIVEDTEPSTFQTFTNLAQIASNASSLFETKTNRKFVAALHTRMYPLSSNPKGVMSLGQDLCSDPTVASSIVVVLGSSTLTINQDYILGPDNADGDGKPWQWLQFTRPMEYMFPTMSRKPVSITGYWGYSAEVPDDVWTAVAQKAAADVCPQLGLMLSKGILKLKEGDLETTYGGTTLGATSPLSNERALWNASFDAVVSARIRTVC